MRARLEGLVEEALLHVAEAFFLPVAPGGEGLDRRLEKLEDEGLLMSYASIRHQPPIPSSVTFLEALVSNNADAYGSILRYIKDSQRRPRDDRLQKPSKVTAQVVSAIRDCELR